MTKVYQPIRPTFGSGAEAWQLGVVDGHTARLLSEKELAFAVSVMNSNSDLLRLARLVAEMLHAVDAEDADVGGCRKTDTILREMDRVAANLERDGVFKLRANPELPPEKVPAKPSAIPATDDRRSLRLKIENGRCVSVIVDGKRLDTVSGLSIVIAADGEIRVDMSILVTKADLEFDKVDINEIREVIDGADRYKADNRGHAVDGAGVRIEPGSECGPTAGEVDAGMDDEECRYHPANTSESSKPPSGS